MKELNEKIISLRKVYATAVLEESKADSNPFNQFELWLQQAIESDILEPHAMNLSTVSAEGKPSSRIVLLRGFDESGFTFYTNYKSHKGNDINQNPYVAINFFWPQLERQIRIDGKAEEIDAGISKAYFESRPRESQLGAWSSAQSQVINNRNVVEEAYTNFSEKFKNQAVPKPEHWGGYLVKPLAIEFWQGRPSRLHDRLRYTQNEAQDWIIERLSP